MMKPAILAFFLGVLLAVPAVRAQQPFNLGFERASTTDPTKPWGLVGSYQWEPSATLVFTLDSTVRREGRYALRVENTDTSSAYGWVYATPPAEGLAGKRVRLRGWIRTEAMDGEAGFNVGSYSNVGPIHMDSLSGAPGGTTPWRHYTVEARVESLATVIAFGLHFSGRRGTAWFDDVTVEIDGQTISAIPGPPPPSDEAVDALRRWALPFRTVEAGGETDDLAAFKTLVGDARIVGLGEATHGTREFFRMKHRLTELLAREAGFTLFAIEDNQLEAERLNRYILHGEGDPDTLQADLFRVWQTEEVRDLVAWMRTYNASGTGRLEFVGYDMQDPQLPIDSVRAFLARWDPEAATLADTAYRDQREACREVQYPRRPAGVYGRWKQGAQAVYAHVVAREDVYRVRAGSEAAAWAVQNARVALQSASLSGSGGSVVMRDSTMAANMVWTLGQRPLGTRAVVWAHNGHVARDPGWMGNFLSQTFGAAYLPIGFATYAGTYTAMKEHQQDTRNRVMAEVEAFPAPPGSVEEALHRVGFPGFALDLRQATATPEGSWLTVPRAFRSIGGLATDYGFYPTFVARQFDALVFIDQTTAARRLR